MLISWEESVNIFKGRPLIIDKFDPEKNFCYSKIELSNLCEEAVLPLSMSGAAGYLNKILEKII